MTVHGLIPAAGLSRRMGRPKLSLPLGDRTVLEHVIVAVTEGGCDTVHVIVGPSATALAPLVRPPAKLLALPADTADMRATVQAGVDHLESQYQPGEEDGLLLALADQPAIAAAVVRRLLAAFAADPHRLHVPVAGGRRGHPLLLPWPLARQIESLPPNEGINALVRAHSDRMVEHRCEETGILTDLDEPADYERLRARWPSS